MKKWDENKATTFGVITIMYLLCVLLRFYFELNTTTEIRNTLFFLAGSAVSLLIFKNKTDNN